MTNLDPWETSNNIIKNELSLVETLDVPTDDVWRLEYLSKLLGRRLEAHFTNNRNEEMRITDLIRSLTIN